MLHTRALLYYDSVLLSLYLKIDMHMTQVFLVVLCKQNS